MPESLDPKITARLAMQGFGELDDPDWAAVLPWLRVAPGVCALWAVAATGTASPASWAWLGVVAAIGSLSPIHPMDLPYHFLGHRRGAPSIPSYGIPRRFACASAALWGWGTAIALVSGRPTTAAILGAAFVVLATIPALTHFCVPSWFFRLSEHVLALPPIGGGDCPARRPRAL
ncbi:MAG: DUF4395 family protein [Gemmatimonadetes bacterium]|nr:DUF4395 family protein [Gemmatimonadota bacterium]